MASFPDMHSLAMYKALNSLSTAWSLTQLRVSQDSFISGSARRPLHRSLFHFTVSHAHPPGGNTGFDIYIHLLFYFALSVSRVGEVANHRKVYNIIIIKQPYDYSLSHPEVLAASRLSYTQQQGLYGLL